MSKQYDSSFTNFTTLENGISLLDYIRKSISPIKKNNGKF